MQYLLPPETITPGWLTNVLRDANVLAQGEVRDVASDATGAFNSRTSRLRLSYSPDAEPDLPTRLILKRNNPEPWGIEAGADEVAFYRLCGALSPAPPAIVPCYAAAYDPASGDSYILLRDLSETHAPPRTRDQQLTITEGVPSDAALGQVIDTLARHHAYWWNHSILSADTFAVGYWSRNAERFELYYQRRLTSWESLATGEASWLPADVRELYAEVIAHLRQHWERFLYPRFQHSANLTLVHGDAYFANFLCPRAGTDGETYLLDWQSPVVDIGGYDLANLLATFWTSEQRHHEDREANLLRRYHACLTAEGVTGYSWNDLLTDYRSGLIYWLLVPLQDRYDGSVKDYWWPKMQCLVAAFREWNCAELL